MTIACIGISSQVVPSDLEAKVERAVRNAMPKHGQTNSTQAAAVAAQQAANATKAKGAVDNAQRQAQTIDKAYTAEELKKQHSRKPTVPAGVHTATSHSQKMGQGIRFGTGAGKAHEIIPIDNGEPQQKDITKQGQRGTIGGDGNSDNPTYKNAKQIKAQTQQMQNRAPRTPTVTTNQNITPQRVSKSPENTQYISQNTAQQATAKKTAAQQASQTQAKSTNSQGKTAHQSNDNQPVKSSSLETVPDHTIAEIPKSEEIKEGLEGDPLALNLAMSRRNLENISNGLKDGWRSPKTAFKEPLYAVPIGQNCAKLVNGKCVKR